MQLHPRALAASALAVLVLAATAAVAEDGAPSGQSVYEVVCASCHGTGVEGAPRIGDRAAWSKRVAQGLPALTRSTLEGTRKMPPHGGDTTLSDLELRRAIVYIVNESGGSWVEPREPGAPTRNRSGAEVVKAACATCHEPGFSGAPRIGDYNAWLPRLRLGIVRVDAAGCQRPIIPASPIADSGTHATRITVQSGHGSRGLRLRQTS